MAGRTSPQKNLSAQWVPSLVPGTPEALKPGMTFTIEMLNAGKACETLADGWTVLSLSAQWEHTLLVTPEVMSYSALLRYEFTISQCPSISD